MIFTSPVHHFVILHLVSSADVVDLSLPPLFFVSTCLHERKIEDLLEIGICSPTPGLCNRLMSIQRVGSCHETTMTDRVWRANRINDRQGQDGGTSVGWQV